MKIFSLTFLLLLLSSTLGWATEIREADYYKLKMIELVKEIKKTAVLQQPNFELVLNGGINIYVADSYVQNGETIVRDFLYSVDGVLLEGLNFGYEFRDDKKTNEKVRKNILAKLALPRQAGVPILNIDYCDELRNRSMATLLARKDNIINFSSDRGLESVPATLLSNKEVSSIQDISNFLAVFNPQRYSTKMQYLKALQKSNYDLLIIDAYYQGELLTAEDIASLKVKPNGKRRLVYSYLSVGEAEDYRYYWQSEYKKNPPPWLAAANEKWKGNYKVQYWHEEWKHILYEGEASYLQKILSAGFDGAFLDVIDSFYYFEALSA
ncbi:MAG: endo alpha-1,4 polygalactosaminidase [Phascolarctobacterium sp.]|nr:endo alpha-1,4 polygalactosaminidase [Phascolarctobacterium sp.]